LHYINFSHTLDYTPDPETNEYNSIPSRKRQPRQKSYGEMFKRRKEAKSQSKSKEKNNQLQSKLLSKSIFFENSEENPSNLNTLSNNPNNDKNFSVFAPYNQVNRSNVLNHMNVSNISQIGGNKRNLSQNINNSNNVNNANNANLSATMQNKILSPKRTYRFKAPIQNNPNTPNSIKMDRSPADLRNRSKTPKNLKTNLYNKDIAKTPSFERNKYNTILNRSKEKDRSMNLNNSKGSIGGYLDMRHSETIEKINKMKYEKLLEETKELRSHPKLSKNSLQIIEKLVDIKQNNVFDRLSNTKNQVRFPK